VQRILIAIYLFAPNSSEAARRPGDPVAWQAALDRAGFSPGVIDGRIERKTTIAIRAFQEAAGLPVSGTPDASTQAALGVDRHAAFIEYTISQRDLADIGPWPRTWHEKARARRLGYPSLAALVAERGHCTVALLERLNPGVRLDRLKSGDALRIPNVRASASAPRAAVIEVDLSEKLVLVRDKSDRVSALFHCSIPRYHSDRPRGTARVIVVKHEPDYLFDPGKWPEVKDVKHKLLIPPGPRSPVGLCWIGLSLKGYGIHGTPEPELIGKTGSHGCIRLTNWDALRLASMVRVGTPVRFVDRTEDSRSAARKAPPLLGVRGR